MSKFERLEFEVEVDFLNAAFDHMTRPQKIKWLTDKLAVILEHKTRMGAADTARILDDNGSLTGTITIYQK